MPEPEERPHEIDNDWYWVNNWRVEGRLWDNEKEHNATKAMKYLREHGFSKWAAAGIVGNMWAESFMSPGQWEFPTGTDTGTGGYGLVQWTGTPNPYIQWAEENDWVWEHNGDLQMQRLTFERQTNIEFVGHPPEYAIGWNGYAHIEPQEGEDDYDAVNYAAAAFVTCYLRPAAGQIEATLSNRQYHSRYVFDHCPGDPYPPWLLFKMSERSRGRYR